MIEKVISYINKHSLITPNSTIIVGLSGGPDSVCLLHILHQLSPQFNVTLIAAHLDHVWRANSADDVFFCKNYADSLNIPFIYNKASEIPLSKKYNGSKEEQGRLLRRSFFSSLAPTHKATAIALGHHLDDQQETFFLRLIRGASIAGLSGIKPQDKLYIRPLLSVYKKEILSYLQAHNLAFLQDPTNDSDLFLRNALRANILPALKLCDDRFDKNFEKTHVHIQQTDAFLARLVQKTINELSLQQSNELHINVSKLLSTDPFLHHPLLLEWLCHEKVSFTPSTAFFNEILRFLEGTSFRHQPEKNWCIEKKDGMAVIKNLQP